MNHLSSSSQELFPRLMTGLYELYHTTMPPDSHSMIDNVTYRSLRECSDPAQEEQPVQSTHPAALWVCGKHHGLPLSCGGMSLTLFPEVQEEVMRLGTLAFPSRAACDHETCCPRTKEFQAEESDRITRSIEPLPLDRQQRAMSPSHTSVGTIRSDATLA